MKKRKLGKQGLEVSALGLGCMGLSFAYGPADETECLRVIDRALDLGVNFLDTAEVYGPYKNEDLIGRALQDKQRDKIIIATKFGFTWDANNAINGVNSKPEHIRQSIEGSLKRLKTDYIDLYYQHRLDPAVPIEETIRTLAELVKAGKVRYIGLSEVGPGIIKRAHAVHPISAVQFEYSVWYRDVEEKILPLTRELGIGFVAYSPLGRGFLTGKLQDLNHLTKDDFRNTLPRLQGDNLNHNIVFVKLINEFCVKHRISQAQLSLAWLLRQGEDIVPIPGTKRIHYLEENIGAVNVALSQSAWDEFHEILASFEFHGARYSEGTMKLIDRSE